MKTYFTYINLTSQKMKYIWKTENRFLRKERIQRVTKIFIKGDFQKGRYIFSNKSTYHTPSYLSPSNYMVYLPVPNHYTFFLSYLWGLYLITYILIKLNILVSVKYSISFTTRTVIYHTLLTSRYTFL